MSIHTITYVLFTKKSFSEPLQEFDFSLTGSQILRNSQVLLNKYFSSTYNFGCKFSKTFSNTKAVSYFFANDIFLQTTMKTCTTMTFSISYFLKTTMKATKLIQILSISRFRYFMSRNIGGRLLITRRMISKIAFQFASDNEWHVAYKKINFLK